MTSVLLAPFAYRAQTPEFPNVPAPGAHPRIVRQVRVGFRGWNSSSRDCFGSLIRERSLRSSFCASSFCRKRKRGDRVACPDRPCLVMPKPFWPPCVILSLSKAVQLISCTQESPRPSFVRFAECKSERQDSPDRQTARGAAVCESKMLQCGRWASSPRTPAELSGPAIILRPVSVSTN